MKTEWMRRMRNPRGGAALLMEFVAALVMVQAMAGIRSLDFRFILPWLFLLFFMEGFRNQSPKAWIGGLAGAALFEILYFVQPETFGLFSAYTVIVPAGGFLLGRMLWSMAEEWRKARDIFPKLLAGGVLLLAANGLFLEGVLLLENAAQAIGVFVLLFVLYLQLWSIWKRTGRGNGYVALGAALFSFFSATGNPAIFDSFGWWGYISALLCWFCLFYAALECCFSIADRTELYDGGEEKRRPWLWGLGFFCIIAAVDCIFLLAFFPGVMEYDSFQQMCQVLGDPYSNHHPWLHTMLIKGIWELGLLVLGSTNRAFALYSLFSICMLSFAFSCVIVWLRSKGMRKGSLIVLGLLYVLSPINQMYSIIMWKDIPFAVSILLFTLLLCILRDRIAEGKSCLACWILFVPLGFRVCFFRSNGLYVFLGMIPFMIWAFWKRKKAVLPAIGLVLIAGALYKGPVFHYFDVAEPDTIESLSIPAQQIAAVITYDGRISEEQKAFLSNVIDLEKVPEAYTSSPTCSDAIKDLVRETDNQEFITEHAGEFLKTWLDLFWKNKRIYVRAFVNETAGYWYHKTYFPFIWATYIQENGMGIDRDSKLPESAVLQIRAYLDAYKAHFDKYLSTGLYVYVFFAALLTSLRKKSRYLLAFLPALGIWGTLLLATPVWADLRYAYAIYVSVPFLVCLALLPERRPKSVAIK